MNIYNKKTSSIVNKNKAALNFESILKKISLSFSLSDERTLIFYIQIIFGELLQDLCEGNPFMTPAVILKLHLHGEREREKTLLLYFIYRLLYIRKKPSNETVHIRSQASSKIIGALFFVL